MSISLDLSVYNTKKSLLSRLAEIFDEMFSLNYDALIDAATFYSSPLQLEFLHCDSFENKKELLEVLHIIEEENNNIEIAIL